MLAESSEEVVNYLSAVGEEEARAIGSRAQERVIAEHSAEKRAEQFEDLVGAKAVAGQYA